MADNSLSYIKASGKKVKLSDNKMHEIKYTTNGMEYLEREFGSITDLDNIDLDEPINIKKFLLAGLIHEYKKETDVPDLFEIGKLVVLMEIKVDEELLRYDLNSFEYLSNAFKVPFKEITKVDLDTFKKIKHFIYAGVISRYPEGEAPELFEVGNMFDLSGKADFNNLLKKAELINIGFDIEDAILSAMIKSMPEAELSEEDDETPKK